MFNRLFCKKCKYYPYFDNQNQSICKGCKTPFTIMHYQIPGLTIETIRVWTNTGN